MPIGEAGQIPAPVRSFADYFLFAALRLLAEYESKC
jgi:hypothetical protein